MGWSVGKVAAFRSYLVMLNYLVEKIKLVAKALPTSSIGSEEHEDLHLRSNWMDEVNVWTERMKVKEVWCGWEGGRRRTDGDHPFGVQTACDDSRSMSLTRTWRGFCCC